MDSESGEAINAGETAHTSSSAKAAATRRASSERADHLKFTMLPDRQETQGGRADGRRKVGEGSQELAKRDR